jgi:hypothetical protein
MTEEVANDKNMQLSQRVAEIKQKNSDVALTINRHGIYGFRKGFFCGDFAISRADYDSILKFYGYSALDPSEATIDFWRKIKAEENTAPTIEEEQKKADDGALVKIFMSHTWLRYEPTVIYPGHYFFPRDKHKEFYRTWLENLLR